MTSSRRRGGGCPVIAMRAFAALSALALVLSWAVPSRAAGEDSRRPSEILAIEAGWLADFRGDQDAFYQRLEYRGRLVRSTGTPFEDPRSFQEPSAKLQDPAGDSEDLVLRLERGAVRASSDLFEVLGVKTLAFSVPSLARWRGSAQVTGTLDGKNLNMGLGLEAPPLHPLRELNRRTPLNATNWIIFGIQGERRERDSVTTAESGVLTARAFVGRGFWWRHSHRLGGVNKDLVRDVLSLASTYAEALERMPAIKERIKAETATPAEKLLQFIAEEGESLDEAQRRNPDRWEADVTRAALEDERLVPPDQPRLLLWIDTGFWRQIGRDRESNAWLNGVVTTMRWVPLPRDADALWVTLRYVNGYERADPRARRDELILTLGTKL